MEITVLSNKTLAKLTYPLFFIVPPNSQAMDILSLISVFSKDKNLRKLSELVNILKYENYEEIVWKAIRNGLDEEIIDLLNNIDIFVETVDENEYKRKIENIFKEHKIIFDIFELKNLPDNFYFILYKTNYRRSFEGFERPIIVHVFNKFYEFSILRAFVLWNLIHAFKLPIGASEAIVDYVIWIKYREKVGAITKDEAERLLKRYESRSYWLLHTFGDWIDKLKVLVDYDFSKSV